MKFTVALLSFLILCFSAFAQEKEEYFHGSAILTQLEYSWNGQNWDVNKMPITGAVTVTRTDRDYGSQGWCPEHWSIQFTPMADEIGNIKEITSDASPNGSSEEWASAWVVNPDGRSLQSPGGNLYIISSYHAKAYLVITPSDPSVRAILDPSTRKYQGAPLFMYGFEMRRISDYMQIDLRNRCSDPDPAGRGVR